MKTLTKIAFVLLFSINTFAQEKHYKFAHFQKIFNEGIYLSFEQFATQLPIKTSQITAIENKSDPQFLTKILSYEQFSFFDEQGCIITISTNKIWGLVYKNNLYIHHNQILSKIHYLGRWSYFIGYKRSIIPETLISPSSYYAISLPLYNIKNSTTNILDIKTGEIKEFTKENLTSLLKNDTVLRLEYKNLPRRKQQQLKYLYLKKINDRNPFNLQSYQSN